MKSPAELEDNSISNERKVPDFINYRSHAQKAQFNAVVILYQLTLKCF